MASPGRGRSDMRWFCVCHGFGLWLGAIGISFLSSGERLVKDQWASWPRLSHTLPSIYPEYSMKRLDKASRLRKIISPALRRRSRRERPKRNESFRRDSCLLLSPGCYRGCTGRLESGSSRLVFHRQSGGSHAGLARNHARETPEHRDHRPRGRRQNHDDGAHPLFRRLQAQGPATSTTATPPPTSIRWKRPRASRSTAPPSRWSGATSASR